MPVKQFTPGGSSESKSGLKMHGTIATARNATAAASIADNTFLGGQAVKAGANFGYRRGLFLFDFRTAVPIELRKIKVIKAQLILNDTSVAVPDTNGNKMMLAHMHNPNAFGAQHVNDYNKARYSKYCSAQIIANGSDGVVYQIDHGALLREIQNAINSQTWLHMATRNLLDYSEATPTGNNYIKFDDVDDNDPIKLKIFYRFLSGKYTRGPRAASKAGFMGSHMRCSSKSGFSS